MSDTPMMIQYKGIKAKHQDAILFFRLGDFYEMFFDDATIASRVLGLTLTGRGKDSQRVPMCGIPFHAAEGYVSKLVKEGYKVAICEQVEAADESKGPTKRDVVRIVTPGTVQLAPVLDASDSNYLAAVAKFKAQYGLAYVDVSTGEFFCDVSHDSHHIQSEIHRLGVKELLLDDALTGQLQHDLITPFFSFELNQAITYICDHFNVKTIDVFNIQQKEASFAAIVAILDYLNYTQKGAFSQIKKIKPVENQKHLFFDAGVIDHLDIFDNKNGLFKSLNKTKTSMGARRLRQYLRYPLIDASDIASRQAQVESIMASGVISSWQESVTNFPDVERLLARICSKFQNPKDVQGILVALNAVNQIYEQVNQLGDAFSTESQVLQALLSADNGLIQLQQQLSCALVDDLPNHIRDGGIFKAGYSTELDELCHSFVDVRNWMQALEPQLKQSLDIKSLKIGFNKVFGYYIEVPNSQKDKIPSDFIRKQTLTNAERYITPELKEKETILLNGKSQQTTLEQQLYTELEQQIESYIEPLQTFAGIIAHVDAIMALGASAIQYEFTKPILKPIANKSLMMHQLWHPMVAQNQQEPFIKNSVHLPESQPFMLITGPNMAGKSTVMRSVAIAVILGQMGSFVPAQAAEFGIVTSIYTRIGANDKLAAGMSTFMVEMVETATICQNATENSLILLDEIGRGTSTFDGVSIAAAVTEYVVTHIKARTLFATHYHELTALSDKYSQIQNASMQIKEVDDALVFAYKLVEGAAHKSYGVMVAKMAGLPKEITDKADAWLNTFEQKAESGEIVQLQLF